MGIRDQLLTQGYFELPPMLPPALVERVRDDVARSAEDAFLEDAMWDMLDLVIPVAREALAHDVAIRHAFWAWRVEPDSSGWYPHRDAPERARDDKGELACISLWIPLTDATTRNGCIHCVPAYWDIAYRSIHRNGVVLNQESVRALPAAAGSVLGWSQSLLHWGGRCAPDASPRLSTSFEMIRTDLVGRESITYPVGWRPPASERRALMDQMRAQYAHMLED